MFPSSGEQAVQNKITEIFNDKCLSPGSRLRNSTRDAQLPDVYAKSFGHLLLDRPLFASEPEINAFATDLGALLELLASLPDRLFDGDVRAYCDALGMDSRLASLMCRGSDVPPPRYARADAYHDGEAFRLLELNVGSQLGGTDTAQVNRALLALPEFADFAEQHRLGHIDTAGRVAAALRRRAAEVTSGEPVVALVESTGGLASYRHVFAAIQEAMARYGVHLLLGEIQELGERNGKITLRGTEIDVLLRYFVASEIVDDPQALAVFDTVLRADEAGRTVLYTPLRGAVFASKGSLAMLHDPLVQATFSPAEQAVVDRVMPWTALLGEARHSPAAHAELLDRCRDRREELVVKPGVGHGGVGTVIGHQVTDAVWRQALLEAAAGDHVVQERVRPATEAVVDAGTGAVHEWVANWGVFVDAEGYAGSFVRALKPGDGAVVAYSNPGTRGTCVFTAP